MSNWVGQARARAKGERQAKYVTPMHIDLNCDLGESSDPARLDLEARVLRCVSSVNIACGFHAGTPDLMRRTVRLARENGVAVGAHPGLRDQEGFGRREYGVSAAEVEDMVAYQVGALAGIAALEGAPLSHVKPHGALYTMAARDSDLAQATARAVAAIDRRLILVGLAGSTLIEAAKAIGLVAAEEAFADRAYHPNGTLVPRDHPEAVIDDRHEVATRALSLVRDGRVSGLDGQPLWIRADTLCIHSDTPGADRLAEAIRHALTNAGIRIAAVGTAHA